MPFAQIWKIYNYNNTGAEVLNDAGNSRTAVDTNDWSDREIPLRKFQIDRIADTREKSNGSGAIGRFRFEQQNSRWKARQTGGSIRFSS